MRRLTPSDVGLDPQVVNEEGFVDMSALAGDPSHPLSVEAVYSREGGDDNHRNHFGQLYQEGAHIWLRWELAAIVLRATELAAARGYQLQILDGFRPVEAQYGMEQFAIANEYDEGLITRPGNGFHPRGLAADIILLDGNGEPVDMGSPFDTFDDTSHRNYAHAAGIMDNRELLNGFMRDAANDLGFTEQNGYRVVEHEEEWWHFHVDGESVKDCHPLSEVLPGYGHVSKEVGSTMQAAETVLKMNTISDEVRSAIADALEVSSEHETEFHVPAVETVHEVRDGELNLDDSVTHS